MLNSIEVWMCPNCGNWVGSSSMEDLDEHQNHRTSLRNLHTEDPSEWGKEIGSRARCPDCRAVSVDSDRVLVRFVNYDKLTEILNKAVEDAYKAEEKAAGGVRFARRK